MGLWFVTLLQVITPRATTSGRISIPSDSMMVGTVSMNEIRIVPEMPDVQRVKGVEAADELYQTYRSYKDMVAFFNQQFRSGGFFVIERRTTQTSTAWNVIRPDNKMATVVVRNTVPTSFEVIEIVERRAIDRERSGVK